MQNHVWNCSFRLAKSCSVSCTNITLAFLPDEWQLSYFVQKCQNRSVWFQDSFPNLSSPHIKCIITKCMHGLITNLIQVSRDEKWRKPRMTNLSLGLWELLDAIFVTLQLAVQKATASGISLAFVVHNSFWRFGRLFQCRTHSIG